MNTYTKSELIAILNADTAAVRKNHIGNDVLLSMLNAVSDNFTATVERGWKRLPINRGSLAECIIKSVFYGVDKTFKTSQGRKDIDLRGVDKARFGIDTKAKGLEVKFATSNGYCLSRRTAFTMSKRKTIKGNTRTMQSLTA